MKVLDLPKAGAGEGRFILNPAYFISANEGHFKTQPCLWVRSINSPVQAIDMDHYTFIYLLEGLDSQAPATMSVTEAPPPRPRGSTHDDDIPF